MVITTVANEKNLSTKKNQRIGKFTKSWWSFYHLCTVMTDEIGTEPLDS